MKEKVEAVLFTHVVGMCLFVLLADVTVVEGVYKRCFTKQGVCGKCEQSGDSATTHEGKEGFCTFNKEWKDVDFVINHMDSNRDRTSRCCDCEDDYGSENMIKREFCTELLKDGEANLESWTLPFTGFDEDGKQIAYHEYEHFCNNPNFGDPMGIKYRMQPSTTKLKDKKDYTNRLHFEDSTVAQEGISFCIIGTHYRKSFFSLWEPLTGFLPLAEKRFDIGNHIDPEDSTKMNALNLQKLKQDATKLLEIKGTSSNQWSFLSAVKYRFENVWLGLQKVDNRDVDEVELHREFAKRPAHPDWQPDPSCKNPYKVKVTMIQVGDKMLHNYLHIKVYSEKGAASTARMCPTGRIKLLMLEVRDQDGLPVGQFTDDVACDLDAKTRNAEKTCPDSAKPCRSGFGSKNNHVPCMFSRPESVVHPSIFMFSAPKSDGSNSGGGGAADQPEACRSNQVKPEDRKPPSADLKYKENAEEYVTEVHATWKYAQMDEGWVSELHFATMIIEDETPIQYYTSRLTHWDGVSTSKACVERVPFTKSRKEEGVCSAPKPGGGSYQWCCPQQSKWTYACAKKLYVVCGPDNPNDNPPDTKECCYEYEWDFKKGNYRSGRIQLALINTCVNETYNTNRPYGYSAQYTVLKPTFHTRGGWDYYRKDYIAPETVDCHVEISYGPQFHYTHQDDSNPDKLGKLPLRKTLSDFLKDKYILENGVIYEPPTEPRRHKVNFGKTYELGDWHTLGMTQHTGEKVPDAEHKLKLHWYLGTTAKSVILKMFDSAHQDPIVLQTEFDNQPSREYFGSRYIVPAGGPPRSTDVEALKKKPDGEGHDHEYTMTKMIKDQNEKVRCPCAFFPTTPPPELATKPAIEIEGRSLHAINMLLAWVVLVPFSFFVSRFFKETYSRVFFLQEFWWLTMHVLSLATAILFTIGGIYALKVKRRLVAEYKYVWTDATKIHVILGYGILFFDIFHLMIGSFRVYDYEMRVIQIGLHWLFGWLEYLCAFACIISSAYIPSGVMSCTTLKVYCGFIAYQIIFTLFMEYHIRRVDLDMNLQPERAYLPPPMMRLFHRNAPKSKFRIKMLVLFLVGCFCFYVAMHVTLRLEGGEYSCFQPYRETAIEISD